MVLLRRCYMSLVLLRVSNRTGPRIRLCSCTWRDSFVCSPFFLAVEIELWLGRSDTGAVLVPLAGLDRELLRSLLLAAGIGGLSAGGCELSSCTDCMFHWLPVGRVVRRQGTRPLAATGSVVSESQFGGCAGLDADRDGKFRKHSKTAIVRDLAGYACVGKRLRVRGVRDDKYIGFGEGRPGYAQSTVESENPLLAAVSRNTVSVSVASGDYARAVVYLGVVCAAGAILAALIASRRVPRSIRRFFACAVPGFFFEGLGVLAFLIPVYWFLIGVRPSEAPEHRARETPGKRALRAT